MRKRAIHTFLVAELDWLYRWRNGSYQEPNPVNHHYYLTLGNKSHPARHKETAYSDTAYDGVRALTTHLKPRYSDAKLGQSDVPAKVPEAKVKPKPEAKVEPKPGVQEHVAQAVAPAYEMAPEAGIYLSDPIEVIQQSELAHNIVTSLLLGIDAREDDWRYLAHDPQYTALRRAFMTIASEILGRN
jgi:hypothetical protein